mgnify:CR=1 FL=1
MKIVKVVRRPYESINKRLRNLFGDGLLCIGPWGCALMIVIMTVACVQLYLSLNR